MAPPRISNPRRILLVSSTSTSTDTDPDTALFLKALTGTPPPTTTPGSSHALDLHTPYYTATVPIWLDALPAGAGAATSWASAYAAPAARPVLRAIAAFVICFVEPDDDGGVATIKHHLSTLHSTTAACGPTWDGVRLAVCMPRPHPPTKPLTDDDWDNICRAYSFEYVSFCASGRNEYNEAVGIERVREALEANAWDDDSFGEFDDEEEEEEEEEEDHLRVVGDEMGRELVGLHSAIYAGGGDGDEEEGDEEEVERLEAAMGRMLAIKDMGDEITPEERRRMAAKALEEIMKSS